MACLMINENTDTQTSMVGVYSFCFMKNFTILPVLRLKVQSSKFYNNKHMIASTQITITEISTLIAVLVFKLLDHKVLFINRKDNRNC